MNTAYKITRSNRSDLYISVAQDMSAYVTLPTRSYAKRKLKLKWLLEVGTTEIIKAARLVV